MREADKELCYNFHSVNTQPDADVRPRFLCCKIEDIVSFSSFTNLNILVSIWTLILDLPRFAV